MMLTSIAFQYMCHLLKEHGPSTPYVRHPTISKIKLSVEISDSFRGEARRKRPPGDFLHLVFPGCRLQFLCWSQKGSWLKPGAQGWVYKQQLMRRLRCNQFCFPWRCVFVKPNQIWQSRPLGFSFCLVSLMVSYKCSEFILQIKRFYGALTLHHFLLLLGLHSFPQAVSAF